MTTSKSFSESVSEVMNANMCAYDKKKALIEIGLTDYEASLLTECYTKVERAKNSKRISFTFGVEIECLVARDRVVERAAANELPINYESYNHIDQNRYFKFTTDSSIRGANPIECVSPVLRSHGGFKILQNACKTLNEAGAAVNRSTGLHVHIGAESLTEQAYVNVFANYKRLERLIDSFMADSRRANNSQWCASLLNHDFSYCTSRVEVRHELDCDRYHKVNPMSYGAHKTIEFRQHQGTTDFTKIKHWVSFCAKLVEYSKEHVFDMYITDINDVPFLSAEEKRYFAGRIAKFNR